MNGSGCRCRRWTGMVVAALAAILGTGLLPSPTVAQQAVPQPLVARPVPGPVVPPLFFRRALQDGTRSPDGSPGPAYWENHALYDIDAELNPEAARVSGHETIRYANNSPDTLPVLVLDLYMNLHQSGTIRDEPQEVTGGVELDSVVVDGATVEERPLNQPSSYGVDATRLIIRPARPVPPGATTTLELSWGEDWPESSSGRVGHSDGVYFVGYWYPQVAVYDDLHGWDAPPYLGTAEFYDDYADYDVRITVPDGWTMVGTGELQNPEEVLSQQTRRRLDAAQAADTVVHVATAADRDAHAVTAHPAGGKLTYHFVADTVRDFAFTASDVQLWDGTSANVPGRPGEGAADRVLINSFWRPDVAPLWAGQAMDAKRAIEHHSRYTGFAYPWPHMTSVEGGGIIGGGMEFPMMTLIGAYRGAGPDDLNGVTAHELGHMWIPMIVGANENRYAWMDEGSTDFIENQEEVGDSVVGDAVFGERRAYLQVARADLEAPLMTPGDDYPPGPAYGTAAYTKPATVLVTLRGLLGDDTFRSAYQAFIREWAFKHPTPWDFFNTFERFAGRDLDWFWNSFYFETWTLDQAVGGVSSRNGQPVVTIRDEGFVPMPAWVRIETTRGGTLEREVPVTTWLHGATEAEIVLPASVGEVTRVEIDPRDLFPDIDRSNNVWTP